LSTANPSSLGSIERSAGYAVPLLQSGLEIDPMQSLLLGTALTRAGATNSKSGTWLREMALRAMPGTSLMSKLAYKRHEEALKEIGLADDKGKPTWFNSEGKPDLLKMLDIGGAGAAKIPVTRRAAIERSLFGAQGGGGFALLADPAVREQILSLQKEMNSPEFKNRYSGFTQAYQQGSTVQNARTAMADFNNTAMDLGQNVLPSVNVALHGFKSVLEGIRGVLPGGDKNDGSIGGRALGGAIVGGMIGSVVPGVGTVGGAVVGGSLGAAEGFMEEYAKAHAGEKKRLPVDLYNERMERFNKQRSDAGKPSQATLAPISLSLNIDGRMIAQSLSTAFAAMYGLPTGAPAADGMGQGYSGDHNFSSK
jgi:hypothetical protein